MRMSNVLSPLQGGLLPRTGRTSIAIPQQQRPRRGPRWLQRMYYRYQPGAILAVFAALVGVPLVLDFFVSPVRDWIDGQANHHEVGVNLLEHILVAALVASAAFYWVLGRKRQIALRSYRSLASKEPWVMVEGSQPKSPVARRAMSKLLAEGIERSPEPALAVVQGRAGTGRTSFIVGLVDDLARRSLIPIPVRVSRDGSLALESLARTRFCHHVDEVLSSDRQADEIWHRAKSTRDVVVLVDGLDDELVASLASDDGAGFQSEIAQLQKHQISIVLAPTAELPLGDRSPLREDLDLFSREEAVRYLHAELKNETLPGDLLEALRRLRDPVDGILIAPFYLDLLVRLGNAGISLERLPEHRDRSRAAVLAMYLHSVGSGRISVSLNGADMDSPVQRGREAKAATEAVARRLVAGRVQFAVALKDLGIDDRALRDAADLHLLWHGEERVGFAADDLGAYLLATTLDNETELLRAVSEVAKSEQPSRRYDRYVVTALIFWHIHHTGPRARASFGQLLDAIERGGWTRPAVVAAAVRVASACQMFEHRERLAGLADRCIDAAEIEASASPGHWHALELSKLVRALAEWPCAEAHLLLWRLATNRTIEVDWPAAKALATAKGAPWEALRPVVEACLRRAEASSTARMSRPEDTLGNEIASLACVLPALRGANETADAHLAAVAQLCLDDDMSPLRGEMALAQGLKLAILKGITPDENVADVRALLFGRDRPPLRYWHARLLLVQALLAHAWHHAERADELDARFAALESTESHPLVLRGIALARQGLRDIRTPSNGRYPLGRYMWTHERDAVRWVEQGKSELAQLAADAVLLNNMTYRLRSSAATHADKVAALSELPRCMRTCMDGESLPNGCTCSQRLCDSPGEPAVAATRAQFSESFCRQQARLAARPGPPAWRRRGLATYRARRRLVKFWDRQDRSRAIEHPAPGDTPASEESGYPLGARRRTAPPQIVGTSRRPRSPEPAPNRAKPTASYGILRRKHQVICRSFILGTFTNRVPENRGVPGSSPGLATAKGL